MVQREVADRFFAVPSTKAYGAVSVLIQLATARTGFHPVSRSVFRPPPNVDSALVAFRRTPLPADFAGLRKVVEGAFAHRRKTLANSLQLAGVATREQAVAALAELGLDPAVRAEALAPPVFLELARLLAVKRLTAHAKINLALVVGPLGERRQARGRDRAAADLARGHRRALRGRAAVRVRVRRRHDRDRGAAGARGRRGRRAVLGASRSRRRSRSPPGSAAAAPTRLPRCGSRTSSCRSRSTAGAARRARGDDRRRRAVLPQPAGRSSARATAPSSRPSTCRSDYWVVLVLPVERGQDLDRVTSTAPSTLRDGAEGFAERRDALLDGARRRPAPAGPRRAPAERSRRRRPSPSGCARRGHSAPT